MQLRENLLNILFPRSCVGCGRLGSYFCSQCRIGMEKLIRTDTICPVCTKPAINGAVHPRCQTKYSPDGLTSIFHYDGVIRNTIKLLKYRRISDVVDELSDIVTSRLNLEGFDSFSHFIFSTHPSITAVPLHASRERTRWFNQSELLAKKLSEKWNIPFRKDILVRSTFNKPQAGLAKRDRQENIKGAFCINPNAQRLTSNASLILFDDVWTTGATMRECVNVLKRAGVKRVWCLTVAR